MTQLWKMLDGIMDAMKSIGAVCLVGMVVVTCVGVVGRIFNHPIFGTEEIVAFLSTVVVAMTLPYAHRAGVHIGVEILIRLFSEKHQDRIRLITDILSLGLFSLVTWRMFVYAHTIQKSGRVSMNLGFPEHTIIYVLAVSFAVFTGFVLKDIVRFFLPNKEE